MCIRDRVEGDVEGSMMFVLSEDSALQLVNKLMSGMLGVPEKPIEECHFGEMECSAMKEVGNIITGAYLNLSLIHISLPIRESARAVFSHNGNKTS